MKYALITKSFKYIFEQKRLEFETMPIDRVGERL